MDSGSCESDISPGSTAEPAKEQSTVGGPGQTRPADDYLDSSQTESGQPGGPVAAPAAEGTGTDYAGTGYAGEAPAAEASATVDAAAGHGGRPGNDETSAPRGSRHGGDESGEAFAESDVVVRETQERPDVQASEGRVAGSGAAARGGQWSEIKAMFVDDPRASVNLASGLVDQVIEDLAAAVRKRHDRLFSSWQNADDATGTEQLRRAFQGYQDLYEQLDQMSGRFVTERATASRAGWQDP
jgi:hypothetical protein